MGFDVTCQVEAYVGGCIDERYEIDGGHVCHVKQLFVRRISSS